ncbi:hypothetical protein RB195_012198 [Necator americanus]|uniref:ShKT domain-containing protein n=1 Tax=Necator americanus TaxID=51031 RepID=A0ABR1D7K0_NECAM
MHQNECYICGRNNVKLGVVAQKAELNTVMSPSNCFPSLLLTLVSTVNLVNTQANCNNAPTEALRIICGQIANWDANAKTVATPSNQTGQDQSPGADAGLGGASAISASAAPTNAYECMDIACLCGFFGGSGGSNCVLRNGQRLGKALRKEYRVMTDVERRRYHTAMRRIKRNGDYDKLSRIYSSFTTSPGAHSGPAFLPWHREFIKRLEIALRRVDPTIALPYWDSTLDSTLPNPRDSSMFTNELMGRQGPDGSIQTGAFRGWRTADGSKVLRRNLGAAGTLLQQSDIDAAMATTDFRQVLAYTAPSPGCPNPAAWTALEYSLGNPRIYVGGDMFQPITSTNDPIFWNHHSFVDLVWENWRVIRQSRAARETQYPPNNPSCSSAAHYGDNTMQPFFPMVNKDGLSNAYTDNLYSYAPRPTCSAANPSGCGSRFLFCDLSHGAPRCAAKIAVNGNCGGYARNEDRCYLSVCKGNRCLQVQTPTPVTRPPITNTAPAGPAQKTFFNPLRRRWADRTLTTYNHNAECKDTEENCCIWARKGHCTDAQYAAYMLKNCSRACGQCGNTKEGDCRPNPDCKNLDEHCCIWAGKGYCTDADYAAYMLKNCSRACGQCGNTKEGDCRPNPELVDNAATRRKEIVDQNQTARTLTNTAAHGRTKAIAPMSAMQRICSRIVPELVDNAATRRKEIVDQNQTARILTKTAANGQTKAIAPMRAMQRICSRIVPELVDNAATRRKEIVDQNQSARILTKTAANGRAKATAPMRDMQRICSRIVPELVDNAATGRKEIVDQNQSARILTKTAANGRAKATAPMRAMQRICSRIVPELVDNAATRRKEIVDQTQTARTLTNTAAYGRAKAIAPMRTMQRICSRIVSELVDNAATGAGQETARTLTNTAAYGRAKAIAPMRTMQRICSRIVPELVDNAATRRKEIVDQTQTARILTTTAAYGRAKAIAPMRTMQRICSRIVPELVDNAATRRKEIVDQTQTARILTTTAAYGRAKAIAPMRTMQRICSRIVPELVDNAATRRKEIVDQTQTARILTTTAAYGRAKAIAPMRTMQRICSRIVPELVDNAATRRKEIVDQTQGVQIVTQCVVFGHPMANVPRGHGFCW